MTSGAFWLLILSKEVRSNNRFKSTLNNLNASMETDFLWYTGRKTNIHEVCYIIFQLRRRSAVSPYTRYLCVHEDAEETKTFSKKGEKVMDGWSLVEMMRGGRTEGRFYRAVVFASLPL